MADLSSVVVPVVIAGAVNGIARYRERGPMGGVEIVFANTALLVTLAGVGNFLDWDLAAALAVLYLIATMLTTGEPVITWFSALVTGKK